MSNFVFPKLIGSSAASIGNLKSIIKEKMYSGFIIKIGASVIRLQASYLKKGLMN